ncbi:hypothetical protein [Acutalibacter muris]|uniref:hypothetical protein n=1 Tax=Acutalibacter muris TaxID=1796620 RepID=UPI001C3EFB56|nr:hypothetical protein [Acutalibacter muris]
MRTGGSVSRLQRLPFFGYLFYFFLLNCAALPIEKVSCTNAALQKHGRDYGKNSRLIFGLKSRRTIVVDDDFAHHGSVYFDVKNGIFMADCSGYAFAQSGLRAIQDRPV